MVTANTNAVVKRYNYLWYKVLIYCFICVAICRPSCMNGGTCDGNRRCQCTPQYTGPTCTIRMYNNYTINAWNAKTYIFIIRIVQYMGTKGALPVFLSTSIINKDFLFISYHNMIRHMKFIGVLIKCAQLKLICFASYQIKRFL